MDLPAEHTSDAATGRRLAAELTAADPVARRQALRELDDRRRQGREVALDPSGLDVTGGADLSAEDLTMLIRLVLQYGAFDPPLDWLRRIQLATELLVRHGAGTGAYSLALAFRLGVDPTGAVREALQYLWVRGFAGADEQAAVIALIDELLDHDALRESALAALQSWARYPEFAVVLAAVLPKLTEAEERRLLVDD